MSAYTWTDYFHTCHEFTCISLAMRINGYCRPCDGLTSHPGKVVTLLVALCYRTTETIVSFAAARAEVTQCSPSLVPNWLRRRLQKPGIRSSHLAHSGPKLPQIFEDCTHFQTGLISRLSLILRWSKVAHPKREFRCTTSDHLIR